MSQDQQNLSDSHLCPSSVSETLISSPTVLNLFSRGTRSEEKMGEAGSEMGDAVVPNQLWA